MKNFATSPSMARLMAISMITFAFSLLPLSLSPQGFNYQGVVRNSDGSVITGQNVNFRFSILNSESVSVYTETHTAAINTQGMVNLVIGGGSPVSGSFSGIDWSAGRYSLKVEIDPTQEGSYTVSESRALQWVPYAKLSEKTSGIAGGKLEIMGDANQNDEEALFEVKRNDGQTVFAVYPDGVRVYVEDPPGKGSKGGFAVGGFDPTKGLTSEFLRVTPDSVRIYIEAEGKKGPKGGFAVGGFDPVKGLTNDYFNVSGKSDAETYAGVPRVLWYPLKEAFLAGNVLVEHPDSVGTNSWASGYQSKAIGNFSQAMGYQAIARGNYSTAIGINSISSGSSSFALGHGAKATDFLSVSIGHSNIASGMGALSVGYNSVASGEYSVAIGNSSQALEMYSCAIGVQAKAIGGTSFAFGSGVHAMGGHSTAMGGSTKAKGWISTTMGFHTIAKSNVSLVIGAFNDTTFVEEPYDWTNPHAPIFIVGNGISEDTRRNAFSILRSGFTSIGHNYPEEMLDVYGNGRFRSVGSSVAGNIPLYITTNGTLSTASSDAQLKTNIKILDNALSIISDLRGVRYQWLSDTDKKEKVGFIAQEVEKVLPEVVFTNPTDGLKGVNYSEITAVLVEAIKEQQQIIESQQSQINELKSLVYKLAEK